MEIKELEKEIKLLKETLEKITTKTQQKIDGCHSVVDFVTNTFDPICIDAKDPKAVFDNYSKYWRDPKKEPVSGKWLNFNDDWQVPMYNHLWEHCFVLLDYESFMNVQTVCKRFKEISKSMSNMSGTKYTQYCALQRNNKIKKNFEELFKEHPLAWQTKKSTSIKTMFKEAFQTNPQKSKIRFEDIIVIGPASSGKSSFLYKWFVGENGKTLLQNHVVESMKLLLKTPQLEKLHLKVTPETVPEIWKMEIVKKYILRRSLGP